MVDDRPIETPPSQIRNTSVEHEDDDYGYGVGTDEQDAFIYNNTDGKDKRIVGRLSLRNFTADRVITIRVKEKINGVDWELVDDPTEYVVGTDPAPCFDLMTHNSFKITAQINTTEAVLKNIHRKISVWNSEC